MNKDLTVEDYEMVQKILHDILNAANLNSEYTFRLSNGFLNLANVSEQMSDNCSYQMIGDAQTAILQSSQNADNIGCFDTTWFTPYPEEETDTKFKPDEVFESFIQHAQKFVKDLERVREMVNTSLQLIDTTISMTKEIETLAKDGKKYLKEKDKHDSKNYSNSNIHP
jgi:hypothetical protein